MPEASNGMKILIATGIYPPAVGGPAQYAKNLEQVWREQGHRVEVRTFRLEHLLPTGLRHTYFFFTIIPAVWRCDFVLALDTFSTGLPAVCAARLLGKKLVIRTGGDLLWEFYVERTKEKILLKNFYSTTRGRWNAKERFIFRITKWTLSHADALIFSTKWQKEIWSEPYALDEKKVFFVENYYGEKEESFEPRDKTFVASTRPLVWKNLGILKEIDVSKTVFDTGRYSYEQLMEKIAHGYAVILVSLGDISPNLILESIRYNKPFVVTEENGLMDRIGEITITVNPLDKKDVEEKVNWLMDERNYKAQAEKIKNFNFTHSWEEIAREIIAIWEKV